MVDRDLVLRRLALVETYVGQLAPYQTIDAAAYRADWKTQRIVERTLHLAIEACMDIADHIVADRRLRVPETGDESFEILAEAGLLPAELGSTLASMVGFRNILVHDYARIDKSLADFERFRTAIAPSI